MGNNPKPELSNATLMALIEIMTIKEVNKLTDKSYSALKRMKQGLEPLEYLPSEIDRGFLAAHGLKICRCCQTGIVPVKPVRQQILTTLCERCWTSDLADLNEHYVNMEN